MDASRKRNSSELDEPITIQRNVPEIFQIFHNVQSNTVLHKKYIKELKKVYRKIDQEAFRESFINALHYTFMFGDANGNVDRVLQFVANFCTVIDDDEHFLHFVFGVIFDCVSVTGQGVRSRSCQLLGLLLTALGEDASLDDDICDKILETQLERLQDVRGAVRCRAVLTLQRLQNPTDEDDAVTKAYIFHMSCDPSGAVRRAVVLSLAKSSRNLLHILERLCDVDESVRKAAFLYVSSINVTQLKVRQRVHILKVGLIERSPRVRKVVETALIPGWLGAYCGDVLSLLASIRLDNVQGAKDSAFVAGNLLQCLFKSSQVTELLEWLPTDPQLKLIPAEKLTKESAWYWRHLVRHLHSTENTDNLEQALPELVIFTDYVRAIVASPCPPIADTKEYSTRQHVLQELMNIFPVYDMADVVGRKALQTLAYDSLIGFYQQFDEEVIRAIMRAVDLVIPDVQNRIEFVASVVSEIHEPIEEIPVPEEVAVESSEVKMMRAGLRVSLNEALEEQEEAVRSQDFSLAAKCKEKVDVINKKLEEMNLNLKEKQAVQPAVEIVKEKRNDPETLNKCLIILIMMLDSPQITKLTPVLKSLFQNFEVMIFQNTEIRQNALKIVGLYSMLDEEFAQEHKAFFFTQFMNMDNEPLLVTALKCVIDIMCIHGVKTFNVEIQESDTNKSRKSVSKAKTPSQSDDPEEEYEAAIYSQTTHDTIIELFLRFMNSECTEYREVVVEGLCRLLMAGRLSSSSIISRLLLLWFNPASEEEVTLRQLLGTFFPAFASHVEDAQEQLEAAFLPTLSTLANAPLTSPLSEVDQEIVLKFMIGLTLPTVAPTARNVHSNLCVLIINALERGAEMTESILCRALALLTPPSTMDLCQDLLRSATTIIKTVSDKNSYRNMTRFQAVLAIAIDALEQRQSTNPGLETLPEDASLAITFDLVKNSNAPEPNAQNLTLTSNRTSQNSERGSVTFNIDCAVSSSPNSNASSGKEAASISPSSPPTKIIAITASDVANRAIRRSTRTPRPGKQPNVSTPVATPGIRTRRNTGSVQKTPAQKPEKRSVKGKSNRKLENELNKVADKEDKGKAKGKTINKKTTKNNKKPVQIEESSESESSLSMSSSDEETILHTICHEKSQAMSMIKDSSSDEEVLIKTKKVLSNITIAATDSESSDSVSSSDDEHVSLIQKQLGRKLQQKK